MKLRHLTRGSKVNQRVAFVAVLLILVLSFVSGLVRTLDVTLSPGTWRWIHDPRAFGYPAVALAVVTFLDSVRRIKWGRQAKMIASQRRGIRNQLSSLVASLSQILERPPGLIGCGLFLVDYRRRWQSPVSGWKLRRPWRREGRLIRVERVRLLDTIQESTVDFTKGKGVVGRCWEKEDTYSFDWSVLNRRHHEDENFRPKQHRGWNGFDEGEWLKMVGRYASVLAVPVTKDRQFVGCVAVDYRWFPEDSDADLVDLNVRTVRESVGGIARTMVNVLSGEAG